jgi:outer membrane lipoprotein LolB
VLFLFLVLLLGACATGARRAAPVPQDAVLTAAGQQANEDRRDWLFQRPAWSFEGRVAVSSGGKGGNGRVEWKQDGRDYEVVLSAPITRQSWRLTGNTHYEAGTLEGLEGGPREGEFADDLLREATGWDIPVNLLPDWARGLVADDSERPEKVEFAADGRIAVIEQMGWRIEYQEWYPADATRPALPRRIEVKQGDAKVRLVVDRWDFAEP